MEYNIGELLLMIAAFTFVSAATIWFWSGFFKNSDW